MSTYELYLNGKKHGELESDTMPGSERFPKEWRILSQSNRNRSVRFTVSAPPHPSLGLKNEIITNIEFRRK